MSSAKDNRADRAAATQRGENTGSPGIADVVLRELYGYWFMKKKGGLLPSRSEIDPNEMRRLLPNIILMDVLRDPLCFRIRLMGTECEAGYGADATNQCLDKLDLGNRTSDILQDCRYAALSQEPLYKYYNVTKQDGHELCFELLLLPLSSDGLTVDMLLGGMAFGRAPAN